MFTFFSAKGKHFSPQVTFKRSKKVKTKLWARLPIIQPGPLCLFSDKSSASLWIKDTAHSLQSLPAKLAVVGDRQTRLTVPSDRQDRWGFLLP